MRILMMIASLAESGGAEMLVRNLALDYARRGHQVHLVYIADAAALNASAAYEQAFKAQLDAAGIGYTLLGHAVRRNLLLGGWRLRRAVRRFRPDVIHMHLAFGLMLQAIGLVRRPTIYTHHNTVFKFPTVLFRAFDRFVSRYVAICEACRDLLANHVGRPITLIYNGVPRDFSPAAPRVSLPSDVSVLSVGNLTPQKNYPLLLEAADRVIARLAQQGRSVTFSIAGEGGERAALEAGIAERGLSARVRLLGARRDVPTLMAQADLLVQCSNFEGLPITLIEAAAAALPAVATNVGGCGEVIADGVTGLLVPPGDAERLAEAIIAVLSDEARYRAFSEAAKVRAGQFELARCADAHLDLYAQVVEERRRGPVRQFPGKDV